MSAVGDDAHHRLLGRLWLVVGFVLAVAATLALVLSTDLRWLRLGIVAALWAALIGAFLAAKYRKHAAQSGDAAAEAQAVYELELEREIAARREFELEIEAAAKEQAEGDSRDELNALRAEVVALRESLQSLFGGEVLYERVALTAQATRMRSVKDDRLVANGEGKGKATPAQLVAGTERPTEVIERVSDPVGAKPAPEKRHPARQPRRAPAPVNGRKPEGDGASPQRINQGDVGAAAARAAKALDQSRAETGARKPPPEAQPQRPQPRRRPQSRRPQPRTAKPAPAQPEQQPIAQAQPARKPAMPPEVSRPVPERPRAGPELTRPAMDRMARGRSAASALPPNPESAAEPKPVVEPVRREEPVTQFYRDWQPAEDADSRQRPVSDLSALFSSRSDLTPVRKPVDDVAAATRHGLHRPIAEQPEVAQHGARTGADTALPELGQERGQSRRRTDEDQATFASPQPTPGVDPASPSPTGGRRRRPDDEPPSWQRAVAAEPATSSRHSSNGSHSFTGGHSANGSHSRIGTAESGARTAPEGRRSAPAPGSRRNGEQGRAKAGSHTAGRSVSELLAEHGAADSVPRRRRRTEDS